MKQTLLSILLVLSTAAQAAMVMPPDMNTPGDRERFVAQMRDEMPSLVTYRARLVVPLTVWAARIDELADRLRKDREFLRLSAQRPDPISFMFYSYSERREKTNGVNPAFIQRTQEYFQTVYAQIYEESEERFLAALRARILELGESATTHSFQGLIAGLAMVLSPEQRRDVLGGRRSLEERAHVLLAAIDKISDEELRRVFQSERFGVPRKSMDKIKAVEMLNQAVQREQELTAAISLLEVHKNGNLQDIDSEDVTWFTGDDMGGLKTGLPDALIERIRAQARNSYASVTEDIVIRTPQTRLIIKEMPPHLAVFRGCPGGDCSTSSSWAYPFSPLERDYYIYTAGNQVAELGYISANITEVNGKPTFFIRDITGRRLAPDHIDLIIEGFAQMLPQLGVEQMTLASPEFTSAQNHFSRLYHRINSITERFEIVDQKFNDVSIRTRLLDKTVGTGNYYDKPELHSRVRLYDSSKSGRRIVQIAAQVMTPEEIDSLPSGGDEEKLQLLIIGYLSNLEFFVKAANPNFNSWKEFRYALRNQDGLPIGKYFERLTKYFREFGLPLNKNLIEKAPDLFYEGQINASNAFKGENATKTFEMVIDRYVERREKSALLKVRSHKQEFLASRPFQNLIQDILTRRRPVDRERIQELWRFGYRFEIQMDDEQTQFFLTSMDEMRNSYPAMLPEIIDLYLVRGKILDIDLERMHTIARWIPMYSRSINNKKWIRILTYFSHFRIRNGDALLRIKQVFDSNHAGVEARFAAALALIASDLEKPENISVRAYTYVRTIHESQSVSDELRQRAVDIFAELGGENVAALDARMEIYTKDGVGKTYLRYCESRVAR